MELFLEIIAGKPLGAKFKVGNGLKIGRKNCDITIEDPKISSYHATLVSRGPAKLQKFYIKDNNSSNGIKLNDLKVPELFLAPGVEFRLGNTTLKVIDASPPKPKELKPEPKKEPVVSPPPTQAQAEAAKAKLPTPPTELPPAPKLEVPPEPPPTWRQNLSKLLENATLRAEDIVNDEIAAFNPPIKFRCVRGHQFGKAWLLGYGPRKIGPKSMDLVLNESEAPPICFEVVPTPSGAEFKTAHPDIVKLNGSSVSNAVLQMGDIVEIFDTHLVVDFDHARN